MGILGKLPIIGDIIKTVFGSRLERDRAHHDEQMQVYDQFASEFRAIEGRTWWDSLIDGLNRLPRPVMTFGVIYLFVLAVTKPNEFVISVQAIRLVPYEMWVTLWMIIGFWFGTKAVEKMPRQWGALKKPDGTKFKSVQTITETRIPTKEKNKPATDKPDDGVRRPHYND